MNNLLNKMERKIGKYAIRNLSLYIIIAYAIGYLLSFTGVMDIFTLDPYRIFNKYEIWRILTWIIVPPGSNGMASVGLMDIFTIFILAIVLYFYYSIGSALERSWGTFRYNLYIFSGFLFTIVGALVFYAIVTLNGSTPVGVGDSISKAFTTYYVNLSIVLAFAVTYPDVHILLFFVIPVRMKWMAYIYAIINTYQFIFVQSYNPIMVASIRISIIMSLLNFFVFFFSTRNYKSISPKEMYRKRAYKEATSSGGSHRQANSVITKHKCAICGRTEKDGDDLEFRFCSKCNGNYEYCNEHLFSHKHIM